MKKILVIKLGALGDFVQAMGAFKAIRAYHDTAEITLMTTPPFEKMGTDCGYFDKIWIDERLSFFHLRALLEIRKTLREGQFNRIYDLQCVSRTNSYFKYLLPKPKTQWSGLAKGCSHPHTDLSRVRLHTYDRHRQQLKLTGITHIPDPDLDWVESDVSKFKLPAPYVLLIPGVAPGGDRKQWPAQNYGKLAVLLQKKGFTPVIIGTQLEKSTAQVIQSMCPEALDLTGQTEPYDVVGLAREAAGAVGNDTGPTHMVAQSHCPITVLFSAHSDPDLFGPRGRHVNTLQREPLKELTPEEVGKSVLKQAKAQEWEKNRIRAAS